MAKRGRPSKNKIDTNSIAENEKSEPASFVIRKAGTEEIVGTTIDYKMIFQLDKSSEEVTLYAVGYRDNVIYEGVDLEEIKEYRRSLIFINSCQNPEINPNDFKIRKMKVTKTVVIYSSMGSDWEDVEV